MIYKTDGAWIEYDPSLEDVCRHGRNHKGQRPVMVGCEVGTDPDHDLEYQLHMH